MHRALPVLREKRHGEQVQKPFDQTRPSVLRCPPATRMMPYGKLADPEAFGMSQNRGETMQLTIQPDAAHDVRAVELESAVEIVQRHTRDGANRGIEEATGKGLPERILTPLLPARHQIETLVELGQKARNFHRVVLEIGVHREDQISRRRREPRCQPARLSEVPPVS